MLVLDHLIAERLIVIVMHEYYAYVCILYNCLFNICTSYRSFLGLGVVTQRPNCCQLVEEAA